MSVIDDGIVKGLFEDDDDPFSRVEVTTIYGDKGTGKTFFVLNSARYFIDTDKYIYVLSFDGQSAAIKRAIVSQVPEARDLIIVKNMSHGTPSFNQEEKMKQDSEDVVNTIKLLTALSEVDDDKKPYLLLIDGMEIFSQKCEIFMRMKYEYPLFGGIRDFNAWKFRNYLMETSHTKALNATRRHLVYTTYPKIIDEDISGGEIINRKKAPNWLGSMEKTTSNVMRTDRIIVPPSLSSSSSSNGKKKAPRRTEVRSLQYFVVTVDSSKTHPEHTGKQYDVTNKSLLHLLDESLVPKKEIDWK